MQRAIAVGISAAILSHLLSGIYPFLVETPAREIGLFLSAGLFYLTSVVCSFGILVAAREHRKVAPLFLRSSNAFPQWQLWVALICFTVAAVAYYQGFRLSENKLAFVFATRLDWLLQIPISLIVLRERLSILNLGGAVLAGIGATLLAWTGNFSLEATMYALVYLVFSLAAYPLSVRVMKHQKGVSAESLFFLRSLFIGAVLLFPAYLSVRSGAGDVPQSVWWIGLSAGICLSLMFWSRFHSLKRIPLSWFSALAPLQAIIAVGCTLYLGRRLPLFLIAGISFVLIGEALFTSCMRSAAQKDQ